MPRGGKLQFGRPGDDELITIMRTAGLCPKRLPNNINFSEYDGVELIDRAKKEIDEKMNPREWGHLIAGVTYVVSKQHEKLLSDSYSAISSMTMSSAGEKANQPKKEGVTEELDFTKVLPKMKEIEASDERKDYAKGIEPWKIDWDFPEDYVDLDVNKPQNEDASKRCVGRPDLMNLASNRKVVEKPFQLPELFEATPMHEPGEGCESSRFLSRCLSFRELNLLEEYDDVEEAEASEEKIPQPSEEDQMRTAAQDMVMEEFLKTLESKATSSTDPLPEPTVDELPLQTEPAPVDSPFKPEPAASPPPVEDLFLNDEMENNDDPPIADSSMADAISAMVEEVQEMQLQQSLDLVPVSGDIETPAPKKRRKSADTGTKPRKARKPKSESASGMSKRIAIELPEEFTATKRRKIKVMEALADEFNDEMGVDTTKLSTDEKVNNVVDALQELGQQMEQQEDVPNENDEFYTARTKALKKLLYGKFAKFLPMFNNNDASIPAIRLEDVAFDESWWAGDDVESKGVHFRPNRLAASFLEILYLKSIDDVTVSQADGSVLTGKSNPAADTRLIS